MCASRRGATKLSGIIALDKPADMTSHDCVNLVRRLTGEGRVGHCGTLDPFATGVLLVCVGSCTRLSNYLMSAHKTYEARVRFGSSTDTDDNTGSVLATAALPQYGNLDVEQYATKILEKFTGDIEQLPPHFSAIKTNGIKAYQQARKGQKVKLEPRHIKVYSAELVAAQTDFWDVRFEVSKGTYIRSLARDIGEAAGSAAHLECLRRVQSGNTDIARCKSISELTDLDSVCRTFVNPAKALGLPVFELSASDYKIVANGGAIMHTSTGAEQCRQYSMIYNNKLLGIYNSANGVLKPEVVLSAGVPIV